MYGAENATIHVDLAARSMLMTDFSDRSMWMTEFSVSYMFRARVPVALGFLNSLGKSPITREFCRLGPELGTFFSKLADR
jgi:hypothetical protein